MELASPGFVLWKSHMSNMRPPGASPVLPLGRLVVTSGAFGSLSANDINAAVDRHARGDWGELDEAARKQNDELVKRGGTVASIYLGSNGVKFYVLTEADRSVTTVLLPMEY
jgi:hypothetical protein